MFNKISKSHTIRGGFYALTIILGMQVALIELDKARLDNFILFTVILSFIFIVELLSGWVFRSQYISTDIISSKLEKRRYIEELIHHSLLPFGLFISSSAFIFFNRQPSHRAIYLISLFLALTILFTNIRAFYEHRSRLEKQTHYIYDVIKLILFFTSVNVLFNWISQPHQIVIPITLSSLLALGLLILSNIRYKRFELTLGLYLIASVILLVLILIIVIPLTNSNPLQTSAFALLIYYLINAIMHHLAHGDLNRELIIEYSIVALLAISLLFGLSR